MANNSTSAPRFSPRPPFARTVQEQPPAAAAAGPPTAPWGRVGELVGGLASTGAAASPPPRAPAVVTTPASVLVPPSGGVTATSGTVNSAPASSVTREIVTAP